MNISFLHTSGSHVERFAKIVEGLDVSVKAQHFVNEELLTTAQKTGSLDVAGFEEEINRIRAQGNDIIICTCSSYGTMCQEAEGVYRIDKPIGEFIIANYVAIGMAYTLNTTREISKDLIEKLATAHGKSIQLIPIDCSKCWAWFAAGDIARYEWEIAQQIKRTPADMDVVFLAQASMEGAQKHLENEAYPLVSSPTYGVKYYVEKHME